MSSLIEQLKCRRIGLGLKQYDMLLRVGMSRQQYQRLESRGNPRLDTLELLAKGLKGELMLIPQDKLNAVKAMLAGNEQSVPSPSGNGTALADDPWRGIFEGDEE